ncbi:hypothetical protein [Arenimonas composti]|uniref:J domain-containing protein n=1 Tax=Arenimonas composti TR7-09 = DSM 18010 TaxID=1121013 RepID=A0A091B8L5_9GAMM|nr:hypothetical protein [Arenimonas composti]KFN48953.1 hypothetical protein P873_01235 [Arenimonas composti TR7-09 = DSM 18010]
MPFAALGLDAGADAAAVKRAYARLLKRTRPDDDPAGFQRLNEAYRQCLALIERRAWESAGQSPAAAVDVAEDHAGDHTRDAAPVHQPAFEPDAEPEPESESESVPEPVPEPETAAEPEPPQLFDFDAFMRELLPLLHAGSPGAVTQWLYARPELYSFQLKQMLTVEVMRIAAGQAPPVPLQTLEALADFFGLDDVGPGGWWLRERVEQTREQVMLRERFRRRPLPRVPSGQRVTWFDAQIDAELVDPPARWRTALLLLTPGMLGRLRNRIGDLEHLGGEIAREAMDPQRRERYLALGDPRRLDWRRLLLSLARSLVHGGLALLLVALFVDADAAAKVAPWLGGLAAALFAAHLLRAGGFALEEALARRLGSWSFELVTLGVLAGSALLAAGGERTRIIAVALAAYAAVRVLGRPRYLLGLLCFLVLYATEATLISFRQWPLPTMLSAMWATPVLAMLVDRGLALRHGGSPREQAAHPRPLQLTFVLLCLLFIAVVAVGIGGAESTANPPPVPTGPAPWHYQPPGTTPPPPVPDQG